MQVSMLLWSDLLRLPEQSLTVIFTVSYWSDEVTDQAKG